MGISPDGPGGGTNARSLAWLTNGLGVKPTHHAKGDKPELPSARVDAGFAADMLGPPPMGRFDALKLETLAKGGGQYLDTAASPIAAASALAPFGAPSCVGAEHDPPDACREHAPRALGRMPQQGRRGHGTAPVPGAVGHGAVLSPSNALGARPASMRAGA